MIPPLPTIHVCAVSQDDDTNKGA